MQQSHFFFFASISESLQLSWIRLIQLDARARVKKRVVKQQFKRTHRLKCACINKASGRPASSRMCVDLSHSISTNPAATNISADATDILCLCVSLMSVANKRKLPTTTHVRHGDHRDAAVGAATTTQKTLPHHDSGDTQNRYGRNVSRTKNATHTHKHPRKPNSGNFAPTATPNPDRR